MFNATKGEHCNQISEPCFWHADTLGGLEILWMWEPLGSGVSLGSTISPTFTSIVHSLESTDAVSVFGGLLNLLARLAGDAR